MIPAHYYAHRICDILNTLSIAPAARLCLMVWCIAEYILNDYRFKILTMLTNSDRANPCNPLF